MAFVYLLTLFAWFRLSLAWINYDTLGTATMTHYVIPEGFIAACGCAPNSTLYPTAALSQMAYGSSMAFGPGCGACFKIGLIDTWTASPPFILSSDMRAEKELVIKITDLCPMIGEGWCSSRSRDDSNPGGQYMNFDLAFPSNAIPEDFFPSNESYYGFSDFGVWNVSYTQVPCSEWAGYNDSAALGEADGFGPESVCCPSDPYTNSSATCGSYSDLNGIAPDATPGNSGSSPTVGYWGWRWAVWASVYISLVAVAHI